MRKSFRSFGAELERAVDAALEASARDLANGITSHAPRGETGDLAASIEAVEVGPSRHRVVIGSDHAAAVEFGTSEIPAQPFIRPEFDRSVPKIVGGVARAIRKV